MQYRIINKNTGKVLAEKAMLANSTFKRVKGLMFSDRMEGFDALIISPCNSIHTFFMKYSIDVIFLNNKLEIVKVKRNISPWRVTPIYFRATQVIEFEAGIVGDNLSEGESVDVVCIN